MIYGDLKIWVNEYVFRWEGILCFPLQRCFYESMFLPGRGVYLNAPAEMRFQKGKVLKLKRVMACICKVFKETIVSAIVEMTQCDIFLFKKVLFRKIVIL